MNTRQLMRKAGVTPDTGADQHFLVDEDVLDRIVEYAPAGEKALEIGGGVGNLTSRLGEKYDNLTVVEMDSQLAEFLESEFPDADVVNADFLDIPVPEFDV
ncbi:MAG: rRNA adenine N-6-methyltransferase family protein, partial [Halobacteria archaeon]|nr:rRNA adenine N-6-methyltransferase family protein [Halobacteria archaeon]